MTRFKTEEERKVLQDYIIDFVLSAQGQIPAFLMGNIIRSYNTESPAGAEVVDEGDAEAVKQVMYRWRQEDRDNFGTRWEEAVKKHSEGLAARQAAAAGINEAVVHDIGSPRTPGTAREEEVNTDEKTRSREWFDWISSKA